MENQNFYEFYLKHKAELTGAVVGLIFAIIVLSIGLFKTLFVILCMSVGYFIGKKLTMDKTFFSKVLDKIFPPGMYR